MKERKIIPDRTHDQSTVPRARMVHYAKTPEAVDIGEDASNVTEMRNRMPDGAVEIPADCRSVIIEYPTGDVLINQQAISRLKAKFGEANVTPLTTGQIRVQLEHPAAVEEINRMTKADTQMRVHAENDYLQLGEVA